MAALYVIHTRAPIEWRDGEDGGGKKRYEIGRGRKKHSIPCGDGEDQSVWVQKRVTKVLSGAIQNPESDKKTRPLETSLKGHFTEKNTNFMHRNLKNDVKGQRAATG